MGVERKGTVRYAYNAASGGDIPPPQLTQRYESSKVLLAFF